MQEPLSLFDQIKLPTAEKFEQDQRFMEELARDQQQHHAALPSRRSSAGLDFERMMDDKLKLVAEKVLEKKVLQEHG